MDIEQKLSAIRAINEEKDSCEVCLKNLNSDSNCVIVAGGKSLYPPPDVHHQVKTILISYYESRKVELITKAEQLMK